MREAYNAVRRLRLSNETRNQVDAVPAYPKWLSTLLDKEVIQRIVHDQRTRPGTLLGWSRDDAFNRAIRGGQANFDQPIEGLTGDDLALLYAYLNQQRHLDELVAAFRLLLDPIPANRGLTILDLGCGPFTAGLAFAAALGPDQPFRYYGIDKYKSMRNLGARLAVAARDSKGLHADTSWWFGDTLDSADFGGQRWDLTLAVASYLFASPTLDVRALAKSLLSAVEKIGRGPVAVLYTNIAMDSANSKFPSFRDSLIAAGFEVQTDNKELFVETDKKKIPLRYALLFRQERTTLNLSASSP